MTRFLCHIAILKLLVEKFVKLKGLRGKVRLSAYTLANFDDFCAKLQFWSSPSKNSWKFEKKSSNCFLCSVAVQSFLQFDEFFRPKSNFRFFEVFFACNLQKAYITKNSRHLACILFNLTNFLVHFGGKPPVSSFHTLSEAKKPNWNFLRKRKKLFSKKWIFSMVLWSNSESRKKIQKNNSPLIFEILFSSETSRNLFFKISGTFSI